MLYQTLDPMHWPVLSAGKIFCIPKSDTAPAGWGAPLEGNEPLGFPGGTSPGITLSSGSVNRIQSSSLPYFMADWVSGDKSIHLQWKVGLPSVHDDERYTGDTIHRYMCFPFDRPIYKDNAVLCYVPALTGSVAGVCVTDISGTKYLISVNVVVNTASIVFQSYRRVWADSYANDLYYDPATNPLGWEAFGQSGALTFTPAVVTDPLDLGGLTLRSGVYFSGDGTIGGAAAFTVYDAYGYRTAYPVGEYVFNVTGSGVDASFSEGEYIVEWTEVRQKDTEYNGAYSRSITSAPDVILGVDYANNTKVYFKYTSTSSEVITQTGVRAEPPDSSIWIEGTGATTLSETITIGSSSYTYTNSGSEQWAAWSQHNASYAHSGSHSGDSLYGVLYADARYGVTVTSREYDNNSFSAVAGPLFGDEIRTVSDSVDRKTTIESSGIDVHNGNRTSNYTIEQDGQYDGLWFVQANEDETEVTTGYTSALWIRMRVLLQADDPDEEFTGDYEETRVILAGVTDIDGNSFIVFPKQIGSTTTPPGQNYAPYVDAVEQEAFYTPWGLNVETNLQMTGARPRWDEVKLI